MAATDPTLPVESPEMRQDSASPVNGPGAQLPRDERSAADGEGPPTIPVEDEIRPWRSGVALSYRRKAIFAVPVDIQTAELPRWRPRSMGDYGRAPQGDE
jgi:hypothetical protein